MKKHLLSLTIVYFGVFSTHAQVGKIGINTIDPQNTLHVNGDVRIDSLQENTASKYFVTTDDNGVMQKMKAQTFGSAVSTKVSAAGIRTSTSILRPYQTWTKITYDDVSNNNDISYDNGKFTVNTEGYYIINVYNEITTLKDSSGANDGSANTIIYRGDDMDDKSSIDSDNDKIIDKNKTGAMLTWHAAGTTKLDHSVSATDYFKKGDVITIITSYTRDYKIKKGNIS